MKWHAIGLAIVALAATPFAQSTRPDLVPIVGHYDCWQQIGFSALIDGQMKFNVVNRKVHYWASAIAAVPLLVMICSGLLLQAKKESAWVQPPERRGTGTTPAISFDQVLERLKLVPDMHVTGWDDVNRMDVRPGRGIVKVWLHNGHEVQVDLGTGAVLQVAYRRSDLIESIHDGSFFAGDWTKLGLFLPAGVTLLLLWCGGAWMFWVPFRAKRKHASARRLAKAGVGRAAAASVNFEP